LAALTLKKTTHEFIVSQKEVKYEFIINNDEVMAKPKEYLKGDKFSLKEICDALGLDTIWPIVNTLRNHVRSYGDKYYYGYNQNVPDEEIVDYIMAVYKYIKFFFDKFNPDIIISPNFVSFPHIMFNLYAKKQGVKMFGLTDSKVRNHHIFSYSHQDNEGGFWERVDALNAGKVDTENRKRAKNYIKEFTEEFIKSEKVSRLKKKKPLLQFIKQEFGPYKQVLRWYIKGPSVNYLESIGISNDYIPPRIILRDHYCHKRYRRFMKNYKKYYLLSKINKYIYFPLQLQPEATMDVLAPYFNNQIEVARLVAMSLPADYTLVVKEHPHMVGLRTPSYIKKIAGTVNVKLIDYRIPTQEVLRRADLVISPNSTTISEAAFLRIPAIQFGNLGTTLKLPNVFKHTDMTTLSAKIKEVLKVNLDTDDYKRRLENFVAAVYDTGFDDNYQTIWQKGRGDMEGLWNIYKKEVEKVLAN
jgi:hypothetical protein